MRFNYKDWAGQNTKYWASLLAQYLDSDGPVTLIEAGCFEGRSAVWFADYLTHSDSRMYCIDSWKGGEEIERTNLGFDMKKVSENYFANIEEHEHCNKIITHVANTEFGLSSLMPTLFRAVDFIYLDASHTQRDTLVDLTLALCLIKEGGLIIVDDYNNRMATDNPMLRPKTAVDFIIKSFDNEVEFFTTPAGQAVIIRK